MAERSSAAKELSISKRDREDQGWNQSLERFAEELAKAGKGDQR